MPSHDAHKMVNQLATGKPYEFVNAWIDQPYKYLGWNHRVARHTPIEIYAHFSKPGGEIDPKIMMAGMLHLMLDKMGSDDPFLRVIFDALGTMTFKPNDQDAMNRVMFAFMLKMQSK